jgi:hypothetical protein
MCIHGFSCLSMKSSFVVNRTKPCCVRQFYAFRCSTVALNMIEIDDDWINNVKSNRHCLLIQTTGNHLNELKIRSDLFHVIETRSQWFYIALEKSCGGLVRALDNASRNRCDATRWRDNFSDQAHPTQRHAVRVHLHQLHDGDTQFRKIRTSEKLEHKLQNKQKLAKILHLLEHVPNTRYGNSYHIGCSSQLVKIIQK